MDKEHFQNVGGKKKTRLGHVLSCFLMGHEYERLGTRSGYHEYRCLRCGHPLLFDIRNDPYATSKRFLKRVRYLCNLFGHRINTVCERHGYTEYACHCGHSFLKQEKGLQVVRHPPICTFLGHFIQEVESRDSILESVCRNCGHTFCLENEVA